MASTADAIAAVTAALAQLPPAESIPEEERFKLLGAIDKVRVAMEPPVLTVRNYCFAHYGLVGIRVAIGMGIFDALAAGGGSPQTISQLSDKTKGDEKLLTRFLRLLVTKNLVVENADQTYQPLPLAMGFVTGSPLVAAIHHFYSNMKVSANLNKFFQATDYANPEDAWAAPFHFAYNTKDHHFDWLQKNPEDLHAFNTLMSLNRQIEGERFPDIPGRLIVEDLSSVIQNIKAPLGEGIEAIGYDMFTEQPVKGAKVYYMRTVLHDWPDKQALEALGHIWDAMAEDSILLINENTLPKKDAPAFSVAMDILMMEMYASLERTEKQWTELLERAHFKVVKIWRGNEQGGGASALYEAVPV
ncbi:S-adenosyl-L-methionine-dependent methyltransferase [Penicillium longicatenatum]|uniref:S-adenosyl-L-methionine-dependent methyltransferase n=1 Tax=Penicillium longicatenatum TaxID=1561947 RepID=UPI002548E0BC|nr:S-adenosyl-L-methionine-dependent methyltransferase [Penicillium longicatenatum]KAJ5631537.1 S-adenosyl-L-methionine-dependent methyltransferase [Penicillium longicatenatum]